MTRQRKIAYLALLGNTLLWGLAIPIVKRGFMGGLTPTIFLFGRYITATAVSLPIILLIWKRPQLKKVFSFKNIPRIVLLEILGTVLALWLLYEGVARTTAVEASLIAVTWPVFVTIGGVMFLKEREERHELLGLLLALLGTTLLVVKPLLEGGINGSTLLGNLLILAQNITIASYYLLAKKYYQGLNKWGVTHLSFWVGIFGFTAIALISGKLTTGYYLLDTVSSLWPLAAILYMGIGGSILGLTLYLIGQDKIEASEAAVFTYLQPVVAIPAAIVLLNESISPLEILGALVIATGVYITEKRH
jgi:drug/metabolite transporter (DMT)-like permease